MLYEAISCMIPKNYGFTSPTLGNLVGSAPAPVIGGESGSVGGNTSKGKIDSKRSAFVNLQDYINANKDEAGQRMGQIYDLLGQSIPQSVDTTTGSSAEIAGRVGNALQNVYGIDTLSQHAGTGEGREDWVKTLAGIAGTSPIDTSAYGSATGQVGQENKFMETSQNEKNRLNELYGKYGKAANEEAFAKYGEDVRNYMSNVAQARGAEQGQQTQENASKEAEAKNLFQGGQIYQANQYGAERGREGTATPPANFNPFPVATPNIPNTGSTDVGGNASRYGQTGGVYPTETTPRGPLPEWARVLLGMAPGGGIFNAIYSRNQQR